MEAIFENSEFYIYGDVYYITNYFCKTLLEEWQISLDCEMHFL